jgi:hypothetical protein
MWIDSASGASATIVPSMMMKRVSDADAGAPSVLIGDGSPPARPPAPRRRPGTSGCRRF